MTTAVANPLDLRAARSYDPSLRKFLIYSIILHAGLVLVGVAATVFHWNRNQWSGTGSLGSVTKATLVSSAGLPMPKPPVVTPSETADPSKSLYKEEPKPKPPEPKTEATPIPKFDKEKKLPPSPKSKVIDKTPPPPNAVPGHGHGVPDIPSGIEQTPGTASGGVATRQQAGGEFESRYPWYIAAAKRRVAPNWNLLFLDPSVRNSQTLHCVIGFTILRDGSIRNLKVEQSSGNSSWDTSGLRAIQSSVPFPPLPSDWPAQDVAVLWDFPDRENP